MGRRHHGGGFSGSESDIAMSLTGWYRSRSLELQPIKLRLLHLDPQGDRLPRGDAHVVATLPAHPGPVLLADDRGALGEAAVVGAEYCDLDPTGAERDCIDLERLPRRNERDHRELAAIRGLDGDEPP